MNGTFRYIAWQSLPMIVPLHPSSKEIAPPRSITPGEPTQDLTEVCLLDFRACSKSTTYFQVFTDDECMASS